MATCIPQNKDDLTYHLTAHLRINAIYWGLTALCVMKHKDALDREEMIEFVMSCWDEEAGRFRLKLCAASVLTFATFAPTIDRSIRRTSIPRRPSPCYAQCNTNPPHPRCHGSCRRGSRYKVCACLAIIRSSRFDLLHHQSSFRCNNRPACSRGTNMERLTRVSPIVLSTRYRFLVAYTSSTLTRPSGTSCAARTSTADLARLSVQRAMLHKVCHARLFGTLLSDTGRYSMRLHRYVGNFGQAA